MEFRDYIEKAEKLTSRFDLAQKLELDPDNLSSMKAGRRSMPDEACVKLGQIVGLENPLDMLAIRNASRAKTEEEREFWSPFVKHAQGFRHAAGMASVAMLLTLFMAAFPTESRASTDNAFNIQLDDNKHYRQYEIQLK